MPLAPDVRIAIATWSSVMLRAIRTKKNRWGMGLNATAIKRRLKKFLKTNVSKNTISKWMKRAGELYAMGSLQTWENLEVEESGLKSVEDDPSKAKLSQINVHIFSSAISRTPTTRFPNFSHRRKEHPYTVSWCKDFPQLFQTKKLSTKTMLYVFVDSHGIVLKVDYFVKIWFTWGGVIHTT